MGGSAHKVWSALLACLQCAHHIFRMFRKASSQSMLGPTFNKERLALYHCLHRTGRTWSPQVKNVGWKTLTNCSSNRLDCLAHIAEHYVEQRWNWAVGDSLAGISIATPSQPHANMMKVVKDHRKSTWVEFLQLTEPKIAKLWGARPFDFSGRAPQPEPWMWPESQAVHVADAFPNDCDALFFDQGDPSKKRDLS